MNNIFLPLEWLSKYLVYNLFLLKPDTIFAKALEFFIYDSIKIFILLALIIFIVSLIRSFIPPEKIKKLLSQKFDFLSNILAALIGTITPFCTCSAIPLFIGFIESGVPLGATFSYLIAAPMVNEIAFAMLFGLFGFKIAFIYWLTGLLIAILAGYILGKMKLESLVQDYVWQIHSNNSLIIENKTWKERIKDSYYYIFDLIKKIFPFVLLGVALGAFIHEYVPQDLLLKIANKENPFAVFFAILLGIPLYSNSAAIVPVISALIEKGLPLGTALAFMMAVIGLSLPEMIILKQVLKTKLLFLYFGIVSLGILIVGYLFNWIF